MPRQSYKSSSSACIAGLITLAAAALGGAAGLANDEENVERSLPAIFDMAQKSKDSRVRAQAMHDQDLLNRAKRLQTTSSLDAAVKYLESENKKTPSILILITLAKYLEREEKDNEALTAYDQAIATKADETIQMAYKIIALEWRGLRYSDVGDYPNAIKCATEVLTISHNKFEALRTKDPAAAEFFSRQELQEICMRSRLLLAVKDYKRSLIDSNEAIKRLPSMSDGYYNKARALQGLGQKQEAITSMKLAVAHGAPAKALSDMELSFRGGNYERDYKALSEAIGESKDAYKLLQQRAELSRKARHYNEALADYQRLLNISNSDDDDELLISRGNIYLEMHLYQQAISDFSKVIKSSPNHAGAAYKARAAAYSALNDSASAKRDLAKAQE